jgi:hypothetical protein
LREFSIFSFSTKAEENIDKMNKKQSEALRHKQYRKGKKAELTKLRALRHYLSKKNPELPPRLRNGIRCVNLS